MFTTLVVPLDGSPAAARALAPAAALARRVGAAVELVIVTSPGLETLDDEQMLKEASTRLGRVEHACRVIERNDLVPAIVHAARGDDQLLCMATHGRTGIARLVLGSTAEAVVRASGKPVMLVGPRATPPARWTVVQACIDTSNAQARATVGTARSLARTLGARLWLIEAEPTWLGPALAAASNEHRLEEIGMQLRRSGATVEWDVMHDDDAAGALLRAAGALRASMMVTGTHARSGLPRAALGSVAAAVVHGAPCPVLVVPPAS